ncbi:hypothetical protein [Rhabdochromatium marinum]|uniref:hypothetical protein n=1 Tax=Rhabdochromatium marinum TaxID=48729 RepID=UPI0019038D16|nr:hypothetical protein [Rhabdochromatium marinum]MBK1647422.1 hypothetical protein [Rhabdochromatium marinum]
MRSVDEASFIGVRDSLIVENNFGHTVVIPESQLIETEPGFSLLMIDSENRFQVSQVWNYEWQSMLAMSMLAMSMLAMSMLARESGIIFAHTADWSSDASSTQGGMYYVSAIDSWDGRVIWRVPLGRGWKSAHEYGGIYFDHDNHLYIGTNAYLISIQNAPL